MADVIAMQDGDHGHTCRNIISERETTQTDSAKQLVKVLATTMTTRTTYGWETSQVPPD